jgi:hypothetical protein
VATWKILLAAAIILAISGCASTQLLDRDGKVKWTVNTRRFDCDHVAFVNQTTTTVKAPDGTVTTTVSETSAIGCKGDTADVLNAASGLAGTLGDVASKFKP